MSEILAAIGAAVIVLPLAMLVIVALLMWRAWWLYPAWGWFMVPLGLPGDSLLALHCAGAHRFDGHDAQQPQEGRPPNGLVVLGGWAVDARHHVAAALVAASLRRISWTSRTT